MALSFLIHNICTYHPSAFYAHHILTDYLLCRILIVAKALFIKSIIALYMSVKCISAIAYFFSSHNTRISFSCSCTSWCIILKIKISSLAFNMIKKQLNLTKVWNLRRSRLLGDWFEVLLQIFSLIYLSFKFWKRRDILRIFSKALKVCEINIIFICRWYSVPIISLMDNIIIIWTEKL